MGTPRGADADSVTSAVAEAVAVVAATAAVLERPLASTFFGCLSSNASASDKDIFLPLLVELEDDALAAAVAAEAAAAAAAAAAAVSLDSASETAVAAEVASAITIDSIDAAVSPSSSSSMRPRIRKQVSSSDGSGHLALELNPPELRLFETIAKGPHSCREGARKATPPPSTSKLLKASSGIKLTGDSAEGSIGGTTTTAVFMRLTSKGRRRDAINTLLRAAMAVTPSKRQIRRGNASERDFKWLAGRAMGSSK